MKRTSESLRPWAALISRTVFFAAVQGFIALILWLTGNHRAWAESARWWMYCAAAANVLSILLLVRFFRSEGSRYRDILRFDRSTVWKDIGLSVLTLLVAAPVAMIPMQVIGTTLFGSYDVVADMMFQPLPLWAIGLGLLFPVTIAFAELPTYFAYVMPRLERTMGWVAAWLTASFFLGLQHATLPLIFDWRFVVWRATMFLPFALLLGIVIRRRPALLPYLMIGHFLIDVSTVAVYLIP